MWKPSPSPSPSHACVLPLSDTDARPSVEHECRETDVMLLRVGLDLGGATSWCVLDVIMLSHLTLPLSISLCLSLSLSPFLCLSLSLVPLSQLMRETETVRLTRLLPLFFSFSSFAPHCLLFCPSIDMPHKSLPLDVKIRL